MYVLVISKKCYHTAMNSIFTPKQLAIGDTTRLSDQSSEWLISEGKAVLEQIIDLSTPFAMHKGRIVFVDKKSVEIEILTVEEKEEVGTNLPSLTVIQAISADKRFNFFLEKTVEIGVTNIFPVLSKYTLVKEKDAIKSAFEWRNVVKEAKKQSRTIYPSKLYNPEFLNENFIKHSLNANVKNSQKICLTTENTDCISLDSYLRSFKNLKNLVVAVGPERGWHPAEIELFKKSGFKFVTLGKNILRTETAGLVLASIFNFVNKGYK